MLKVLYLFVVVKMWVNCHSNNIYCSLLTLFLWQINLKYTASHSLLLSWSTTIRIKYSYGMLMHLAEASSSHYATLSSVMILVGCGCSLFCFLDHQRFFLFFKQMPRFMQIYGFLVKTKSWKIFMVGGGCDEIFIKMK